MRLHAERNNATILVCLEHVTVITPLETCTRIYTDDGDYTDVKEDLKAIINIIRGCAI